MTRPKKFEIPAAAARRPAPQRRVRSQKPTKEGTVLTAYLARAGVCSRRAAKEYVVEGRVTVDGVIITDPAFRIIGEMRVACDGNQLSISQEDIVYIAFNKPRGVITTCKDQQDRLTVVDAVRYKHLRLFPVGRLDRNTSGLLLLTNDGPFAHRAMHPSFNVKKEYHVTLDKPITPEALDILRGGVFLHDGRCKPDKVYLPHPKNLWVVGVEIHSGKYHIIRRLFYSVGYNVEQLARVGYGPISVKGIAEGAWKLLKREAVADLTAERVIERPKRKPVRKKPVVKASAAEVVSEPSAE